jgi:hypothetical protein
VVTAGKDRPFLQKPPVNEVTRPPLGVLPNWVWVERRKLELALAIGRYAEHAQNDPNADQSALMARAATWAGELTFLGGLNLPPS